MWRFGPDSTGPELEQELKWLERSDPGDLSVQATLSEARARKADKLVAKLPQEPDPGGGGGGTFPCEGGRAPAAGESATIRVDGVPVQANQIEVFVGRNVEGGILGITFVLEACDPARESYRGVSIRIPMSTMA